jgi:hypothetical protein
VQLKADITYGEESKLYQRYNGIRQYIVKSRNLPVDVEVPPVVSPEGEAATSPAPVLTGRPVQLSAGPEADFSRYVSLMVKQFNGQLGEQTRAAIKSRQRILNVSDERADAIVAQAVAALAPKPNPVAQYKQSVESFMSPTGELSEDALIELVNLQDEYGIDEEVARRIQQEVRAARGNTGLVQ